MTVRLGEKERTVVINFLEKDGIAEHDRKTVRRAVRVWASLRGLIDEKEAFDIRPYEEDLRK
jgi:hypothetical protein